MAKFKMELPTEILEDFEKIYGNTEKIFGGMTQAGAKIVYEEVKKNMPSWVRDSDMMNCLCISEVYKTPSDDGINSQVHFGGGPMKGYFINHDGVKTAAPLVANIIEYGRHDDGTIKNPDIKMKKFFRKSFNKSKVEKAMLKAQRELSGGLLE